MQQKGRPYRRGSQRDGDPSGALLPPDEHRRGQAGRARTRPLHTEQGALGGGPLRRPGGQGLLPGGGTGGLSEFWREAHGPPEQPGAGDRDEHRLPGARAVPGRGHGPRRPPQGPGQPDLRPNGRRGAGRGLRLGGRHGRLALRAGQPVRHGGPQRSADLGRHGGDHWSRASGRALPQLRLECDRGPRRKQL